MFRVQTLSSSRASKYLGVLIVLAVFGLPLFFGLSRTDLRNDEAIYSYAVDRILETGEWLTPRSIQVDGRFLEKPPLKFWIVAGLMRLNIVAHDDRGQRFVDAVFGALAFAYVFAIGRRTAGAVAGFAAVLILFTMYRLMFDHGLRSNNMEAALVLAYCGGIYHFGRWQESADDRGGRWHALATALYFVLGFMTKFVAVFFLPVVCGVALVWTSRPWERLRTAWRSWLIPCAAALVLIAPWFVYQTWHAGSYFWRVIFGAHVFTRFTSSLDPHHLHPWPFYFVETWKELASDGSHWIAAAGMVVLVLKAWSGRPPFARLVLVWWVVPFALISLGTSKLFHYAYPFLPPIAIGAGTAAAEIVRRIGDELAGRSWSLTSIQRRVAGLPAVRHVLTATVVIALAIAVWTFVVGNVVLMVDGDRWFRSSSLARPIFVAGLALWLRGSIELSMRTFALVPLLVLLPVYDYPRTLGEMTSEHHPLRTLRDCALTVRRTRPDAAEGVYNAARPLVYRSYYYYLRGLGRWVEADHPDRANLDRRLYCPGDQTPVLVSVPDYVDMVLAGGPPAGQCADTEGASGERAQAASMMTSVMTAPSEGIIMVLPGPYAACGESVIDAGGVLADLPVGETAR